MNNILNKNFSKEDLQKMMEQKIKEEEVAYFGENPKLNFVYGIHKNDWFK